MASKRCFSNALSPWASTLPGAGAKARRPEFVISGKE